MDTVARAWRLCGLGTWLLAGWSVVLVENEEVRQSVPDLGGSLQAAEYSRLAYARKKCRLLGYTVL